MGNPISSPADLPNPGLEPRDHLLCGWFYANFRYQTLGRKLQGVVSDTPHHTDSISHPKLKLICRAAPASASPKRPLNPPDWTSALSPHQNQGQDLPTHHPDNYP